MSKKRRRALAKTEPRSVRLEVIHAYHHGAYAPSVCRPRVTLDRDGLAHLEIDLDVRLVDQVIIRPIRRPMSDVEGAIRDAKRLANS